MTDKFADRAADWDKSDKIEMTHLFVMELLKHVEVNPEWKALEIGAGTGLAGLELLQQLNYLVFEDTSDAMLSVLKSKADGLSNFEVLHGLVTDYKKADIDLAFSSMAFHHISDIEQTLAHLHSIMKPNGKIVIGDIRTENGSFHHFEPIPHTGFDTNELSVQFEKAGFKVQTVKTYNILKRERTPGVITDYEQFILVAEKA